MKEMVETLSHTIQERLSFHDEEHVKLVQRALLLYRQNLVYQVRPTGRNEVTATVQDVTPVKVRLNGDELEESSCECPQHGVCRHQLAVFFAMLSKYQSVSKWVENWRSNGVLANLQIQKGVTKQTKVEDKVPGWLSRFEDEWRKLGDSKSVTNLNRMYHQCRWQEPENRQLKLIYRLALQIFFLQKLFTVSPRETDNVRIQIEYYIDQARETMQAFQTQTLSFDTDTYFRQLGAELRPIMKEGHQLLLEKFNLYTDFWTFLCKSPTLRQEERKWWQEVIEEEHPSFANQPSLYIAYWHIQILTGYEEQVLASLDDQMEPSYVYILLHWLHYFITEKQWTRSNTFFEKFLQWWPQYATAVEKQQAIDTAEQAVHLAKLYSYQRKLLIHEKLLETLLPYSFHDYTQHMVNTKQYRKWVELLHSISYRVQDIPKELLMSVEGDDPRLLLPLYHRSIQHLIEEKKRQSYRDAVRYLKKLRKLYEEIGEYETWNAYITSLIEHTSRLRAFHEECKRGKLLNGPVKIN